MNMAVASVQQPGTSMPGAHEETFADGKIIYRAGAPADHVYIIRSGRVRLYAMRAKEKPSVVSILRAGDFFGAIMVAEPDALYDEMAEASGDVEVWAMSTAFLDEFLRAKPEVALTYLRGAYERIRGLRRRVASLTTQEAPGRIAETILSLAESLGDPCAHGGEVELRGVTQQDIADLVGVTRGFASTHINEMKRAKLLSSAGRALCIRNRAGLRKLAGVRA